MGNKREEFGKVKDSSLGFIENSFNKMIEKLVLEGNLGTPWETSGKNIATF